MDRKAFQRIDGRNADLVAIAAELRRSGAAEQAGIASAVAETITAVREGGDTAVIALGERFDGERVAALRVPDSASAAAEAALDPELRSALERSAANIRAVAEAQVAPDSAAGAREPDLPDGQLIEVAEVPVASAGIYAPGGRSPYPSSVLMGVVPAIAAGVGRVVVASPPDTGGLPNATVMAAARIAGACEVYAMGGAQAVAALAYGTESVAPVDVIAGPGSPWVQEAKLQCSRVCGSDGYKGPSELLVVCDAEADARLIALDLCAQGEHGDDGLVAVASPDSAILSAIAAEVKALAVDRPSVASPPLAFVEVTDIAAGLALSEALAPEHLELACADARELARTVTTAGCVFTGRNGGAAFGDYSAGSNHVLPTGGAGRFTGPLGPTTFRRKISRVEITDDAAAALAPLVDEIARTEGFPVHGESAVARVDRGASSPPEPSS